MITSSRTDSAEKTLDTPRIRRQADHIVLDYRRSSLTASQLRDMFAELADSSNMQYFKSVTFIIRESGGTLEVITRKGAKS